MAIITIAISLYLASKVYTINLEIILLLAKYTIPMLGMISLTFDTITIRDIKVWFKKATINILTYMTMYIAILFLLNKFF